MRIGELTHNAGHALAGQLLHGQRADPICSIDAVPLEASVTLSALRRFAVQGEELLVNKPGLHWA